MIAHKLIKQKLNKLKLENWAINNKNTPPTPTKTSVILEFFI